MNGLVGSEGAVCVVVGGAGKKRDILIRRRHPMIAVPRGVGGRTSGGLRVSRSTCNRVLMQGQSYLVKTVLEQCDARMKAFLAFKESPINTLALSPV